MQRPGYAALHCQLAARGAGPAPDPGSPGGTGGSAAASSGGTRHSAASAWACHWAAPGGQVQGSSSRPSPDSAPKMSAVLGTSVEAAYRATQANAGSQLGIGTQHGRDKRTDPLPLTGTNSTTCALIFYAGCLHCTQRMSAGLSPWGCEGGGSERRPARPRPSAALAAAAAAAAAAAPGSRSRRRRPAASCRAPALTARGGALPAAQQQAGRGRPQPGARPPARSSPPPSPLLLQTTWQQVGVVAPLVPPAATACPAPGGGNSPALVLPGHGALQPCAAAGRLPAAPLPRLAS